VTIDELELLYLKRDFNAFDALAAKLQHSLDETEQRETERYLALSYLTRRKYSGVTQFDNQLDFYKNILQYADNEQLIFKLSFAKILIFQKDFAKADSLLHSILAKARIREQTELQILALATMAEWHIEQNQFREAIQLVKGLIAQWIESKISIFAQSEIYNMLTLALLRSQDFGDLEKYSKKLLELSISTQDVEKQIVAYNNLAIIHSIGNDYKTAMSYFLEALDRAIAINYRKSIADTLINIGTIYANLQNHEEALARYQTILEDYHDVLAVSTLAIVYNNVGNIFYLLEDAKQAKTYFEKSLEFAIASQYQEMTALAYTQISRVYRMEGNTDDALVFAERARHLMEEKGETSGLQLNLINLAQLHYDLVDLDSAIGLANQGLEVAEKAGDDVNRMKAMRLLSTIYASQKDFQRAYHYQNDYSTLQDKVVKEQSRLHAIDIEIRYDIREKQRQIEQLKRENEFQGKLIVQGEQIAEQNTQLVFANEELQQFAYIVSHDLKEPLRMIASYAQLIMFRYKNVVDENFQTYLDFMSEGVTRMNSLLDGLLQYGTVGKEKEEQEDVDIQEVIDAAAFNLKLLIRETNAEIEIGKMPIIIAHPSRMTQLFQNLINNAIKFRAAEVTPKINITCSKKGKFYHFKVVDNGIGIEPEHRERIFAIFQRLHTRQKYEGTGIGLSICQKIVQHLGGQIWVEDSELGGSAFCFDIPVKRI
jgi:signal transduction histidine kinase